jgi:Glycosyl transferases group 1
MPPSRIFYHCYDIQKRSGGQKHTYQHVDILTRNGFDAYVLHKRTGFRLTWFENDTRLAYRPDVTLDPSADIVVFPENLDPSLYNFSGRKVIFNKNIYHGFKALAPTRQGPESILSDDIVAILSISPHNQSYLQFAYPGKPILLVTPDIRVELFKYRPLPSKRFVIACNDKADSHVTAVYQMLLARGLRGLNRASAVEWVRLVELSEHQVSDVLQEALLLIFLSVEEGLGRLPLEAMACGCLVCAYDGGPLDFLPTSYRFAYGDLMSIALHVERVLDAFPSSLGQFEDVTLAARHIAEGYSHAQQETSVLKAWEFILSRT